MADQQIPPQDQNPNPNPPPVDELERQWQNQEHAGDTHVYAGGEGSMEKIGAALRNGFIVGAASFIIAFFWGPNGFRWEGVFWAGLLTATVLFGTFVQKFLGDAVAKAVELIAFLKRGDAKLYKALLFALILVVATIATWTSTKILDDTGSVDVPLSVLVTLLGGTLMASFLAGLVVKVAWKFMPNSDHEKITAYEIFTVVAAIVVGIWVVASSSDDGFVIKLIPAKFHFARLPWIAELLIASAGTAGGLWVVRWIVNYFRTASTGGEPETYIPGMNVVKWVGAGFIGVGSITTCWGLIEGGFNGGASMVYAAGASILILIAAYIAKILLFKKLMAAWDPEDKRWDKAVSAMKTFVGLLIIAVVLLFPAYNTFALLNAKFCRANTVNIARKTSLAQSGAFASEVDGQVKIYRGIKGAAWADAQEQGLGIFNEARARLAKCAEVTCLEEVFGELQKTAEPLASLAPDQYSAMRPPAIPSPYAQASDNLQLLVEGKMEREVKGQFYPALGLGWFLDYGMLSLVLMIWLFSGKRRPKKNVTPPPPSSPLGGPQTQPPPGQVMSN